MPGKVSGSVSVYCTIKFYALVVRWKWRLVRGTVTTVKWTLWLNIYDWGLLNYAWGTGNLVRKHAFKHTSDSFKKKFVQRIYFFPYGGIPLFAKFSFSHSFEAPYYADCYRWPSGSRPIHWNFLVRWLISFSEIKFGAASIF